MQIVDVDISSLKPAEYNSRAMTKKEAADLTESIKRFGMVEPIVVNSAKGREQVVIGGHQRLNICKALSWEKIPVNYVDVPDIEKEQELNLRLNKNLGHWDNDLLANFDEKLLLDVGWEAKELDFIFQLDMSKEEKPMGFLHEYCDVIRGRYVKNELF